MEAIKLQLQQFVQCAEESAAALIPADVEAISRYALELKIAGERHMAATERLESYLEERRAFHTCVQQSRCDARQAAAISTGRSYRVVTCPRMASTPRRPPASRC